MYIKKIFRKLFYITLYIFFFILLILNKIIRIRIHLIDYSAIGAYTQLDFNLIMNNINNVKSINVVFSATNWGMINYDWLKLWKKKYYIITNFSYLNLVLNDFNKINFFKILFADPIKFNKMISNSSNFNKFVRVLNNKNTPNIKFNNNQINYGKNILNNLNLKKYICIHARDNIFRKHLNVNINWDYHNYRDSNINTYLEGTYKLSELGYQIVRMGYKVKDMDKKFLTNQNIIDYSNSKFRNNFNDIYLSANCEFFVVSDTGASSFPEAFRKPIVYVNLSEIISIYNTATISGGVIIFKKYFSKKLNRFLNLNEIVKLDISKGYQKMLNINQIELIENSPDEIYNACLEMRSRLNKKWVDSQSNMNNQAKFWEILNINEIYTKKFHISEYFFEQNKYFLNY